MRHTMATRVVVAVALVLLVASALFALASG